MPPYELPLTTKGKEFSIGPNPKAFTSARKDLLQQLGPKPKEVRLSLRAGVWVWQSRELENPNP